VVFQCPGIDCSGPKADFTALEKKNLFIFADAEHSYPVVKNMRQVLIGNAKQ
jgi:hypothetical protein